MPSIDALRNAYEENSLENSWMILSLALIAGAPDMTYKQTGRS